MDFDTAYNILNLDPREDYTIRDIRKKYHILALEFHPDKNKHKNKNNNSGIDANEKFQKISEAYELIKPLYENDDTRKNREKDRGKGTKEEERERGKHSRDKSYMDIVYEFFGEISGGANGNHSHIVDIFHNECYEYIIETIEKMDYSLLIELSRYIEMYFKIFNIPGGVREKISETISRRCSDMTYHEIRPSLQNLINNEIYPFVISDSDTDSEMPLPICYVPLWHRELIYDKRVIVCRPILPDHISLDDDNNILYRLELKMDDIWKAESECKAEGDSKAEAKAAFYLPEFPNIKIDYRDLYIRKVQTLVFRGGSGISRINSKNILDIREKGDLSVIVTLI